MNNKFVVFVNTTDSFSDCWYPFFKLFETYWPNYEGEIYLNTEYKNFQYGNLNLISVCNKKSNWSDSVAYALNNNKSDYILYLQDDYFFKDYVKTIELYDFFNTMIENDFDCLHLTDQCSDGPFENTEFVNIVKFSQKAYNKISCQAAFWKREIFLKYLIPGDSGWYFEKYGTKLSHYEYHNFYCLSKTYIELNKFEIIPYIVTGIVNGKWLKEVLDLFKRNEIYVNFDQRGFYSQPPKKKIRLRFIKKIERFPRYLLNQYLICIIRLRNIFNKMIR